jgi:hypothetical protein
MLCTLSIVKSKQFYFKSNFEHDNSLVKQVKWYLAVVGLDIVSKITIFIYCCDEISLPWGVNLKKVNSNQWIPRKEEF